MSDALTPKQKRTFEQGIDRDGFGGFLLDSERVRTIEARTGRLPEAVRGAWSELESKAEALREVLRDHGVEMDG